MIRISNTRSRLFALALCTSLFSSLALAGGAGNGNGNGQNTNTQVRVDALEAQVTTLTQDVQTLSQQLSTTQSEVAALQTSDASQTQTLQALTQQLMATQSDLAAAQTQLQATQSQLTALATADSTLQAQLTALQTTVTGTQTQLDTLNAAAAGTQSQLAVLAAADAALQVQVDTLKAADTATQSQLTSLQAQLSTVQTQLDSYKNTTASQAQLADLQAQISALQTQVSNLGQSDPSQYYKRDGSVALTGTLAGGGQDAANLRNITASGTVSATKLSAVNITPELTVVAGTTCDPATQGSLAKDGQGSLLSCQSGSWAAQAQSSTMIVSGSGTYYGQYSDQTTPTKVIACSSPGMGWNSSNAYLSACLWDNSSRRYYVMYHSVNRGWADWLLVIR